MTDNLSSQIVLVTGASGFIASHCMLQLLEQGYSVRGTLRNPLQVQRLQQTLAKHVDIDNKLEFVVADLNSEEGWQQAVEDCSYVLHTASPFPAEAPANEDDLVRPAREGSLRILKASATAGVKRVVLTSSTTAIVKGHKDYNRSFNELDWSNLEGDVSAYAKSKTLAERACWDFVNSQSKDSPIELTVIIPGLVMGPLLDSSSYGTSAKLLRNILIGVDRGDFRNRIELVDVRDVASAHLAAMTNSIASNKRYCCVAETLARQQVIDILDEHFSRFGYKLLMDGSSDPAEELGPLFQISNKRIREELGWQPRSAAEALIAMAESLIQFRII